MMRRIFDYLKKNNITDIQAINRLFVSVFLAYNRLEVKRNPLLKSYVIGYDTADHIHLSRILDQMNKYKVDLDLEGLISLFEFVISPSDRVVTGAIYTPRYIRKKIVETVFANVTIDMLTKSKIADISCGCGGFLIDAAVYVHERTGKSYIDIIKDNIYGIDIEDYSVERSRIVLSLLAIINGEDINLDFHLLVSNTLDYYGGKSFNEDYRHFDFILGNPPYVCSRNMCLETRNKLKNYEVCRWGHPDLYIPFIQIASDMLNNGGKMGFITMNSFFNSLNGRGLREYLAKGQLQVNIADFRSHQVFRSKSTYTCLLFLTRIKDDALWYSNIEEKNLDDEIVYERIRYNDLNAINGWNLNGYAYAKKVESVGIPLGRFCKSRHGIATLSNKTFIFKPVGENTDYYYHKVYDKTYLIEKKICRDVVNSNKLNSEQDFDSLIEKVIFPYHIDEQGKAEIIYEDEMMMCYPHAYYYLQTRMDILNKRDKGKTKDYPTWYAFGRTQSLIMPRYKLFFPKIANKPLHCIIVDDPNLLLYNGMAFVNDERPKLEVLKRFLESKVFWKYVNATAKPYSSGYSSLNGLNILKFGVPELDKEQTEFLLSASNTLEIDDQLCKLYEINCHNEI